MDGACMELGCDCVLSELYAVATQAAELRERLKEYEDAEEMKQKISKIKKKAERRNDGRKR